VPVAESWIAAIRLLLLGWSFRGDEDDAGDPP
jgi:hypothetical protein